MQRQSLGSPNSKLHIHGGGGGGGGGLSPPKQDPHVTTEISDSSKRKDYSPSSSSDDEQQHKSLKPRRLSLSQSPPSKPENLIHLIPLLTLICFLILYLSSHDPSPSDLAQFNGFRTSSKHIGSSEMSRFVELRSLRNLQEIGKHAPKSRSNRKFADF